MAGSITLEQLQEYMRKQSEEDRGTKTLTVEAETRMRKFLAEHPGDGGGGGVRYRWADTGLDADELRERARPYQERFGVESEPVA